MRRDLQGGGVARVQPTDRTLRRLHSLTTAALEKGGEDRVRIVNALGRILLECFDETYEAIGQDQVLLKNFKSLGVNYGYEDDHDNN